MSSTRATFGSAESLRHYRYVDGLPIEDAACQPQSVRDQIATQLIELTLKELFVFGHMQTDPNFANYLYQSDTQRIVLLDFGAARMIDPVVIDQYRRLMQAGLADDLEGLTQIISEIGFVGPDTKDSHRTQIIHMIRLVFASTKDEPLMDFTKTELSRQMQAEGMALAKDGFVPPPLPIDILLLQRKFGGVFLLAARLGAHVDMTQLIDQYMDEKLQALSP